MWPPGQKVSVTKNSTCRRLSEGQLVTGYVVIMAMVRTQSLFVGEM